MAGVRPPLPTPIAGVAPRRWVGGMPGGGALIGGLTGGTLGDGPAVGNGVGPRTGPAGSGEGPANGPDNGPDDGAARVDTLGVGAPTLGIVPWRGMSALLNA
jgi:hypothetical protein